MAKVKGLNLREGRWHVRIVIPEDLKTTYGKARVNPALGTAERREATLLATITRAEWLAEFEAKRGALTPSEVSAISPELGRLLAERVRATVLAGDDSHRSDLPLLAEMARMRRGLDWKAASPLHIPQWTPAEPREDDLSGMTPDEAEEFARLNAYFDGKAAIALAGGNLASVLALAQNEAGRVGVKFRPNTSGAREALKLCLKAYRTAHREITMRDAGEIIDTPIVLVTEPLALKVYTLRDVYGRWKDSKPRSSDSLKTCLRSVTLYEGFTGNPPITQLTREQGDGFRTWLQQPDRKTTSKTARDRLTWVKSVLKYAARDLGWIPKSPWEGIDIAFKTTNKRRPWTDGELKTFFTQSLHTSFKLPREKKAGADAAYWIPLLGLYSGARVGELAQLRVCDVEMAGDFPVLSITDEGEGQSVKSQAGVRKVPIHSELVRLGFLDYVAALKERKEDQLWPLLPTRESKPGGYFSHWFGAYRRSLGFGTYPDFHCLRHTVRSQLAEAEVSEQVIDAIVGHEVKGSTGAKVYTHRSLTGLKRAIEAIRYPALSIPHVAPALKHCP